MVLKSEASCHISGEKFCIFELPGFENMNPSPCNEADKAGTLIKKANIDDSAQVQCLVLAIYFAIT